MKCCATCRTEQDITNFHFCRSRKDGRQPSCKACNAAWAKANRPSKRKARNAYYERNTATEIAKVIAWRAANRDKARSASSRYHKKNGNQISARKRANRHAATPAWADSAAIKKLYAEARRLTMETGVLHEVDHIVPLKSPLVCGLHWEANLQVLPSVANRIKSNKLIEAANGR